MVKIKADLNRREVRNFNKHLNIIKGVKKMAGVSFIGRGATLKYNEPIRAVWHTIELRTPEIRTVIDPGLSMQRIEMAKDMESIIVSHAHEDHIGGLPDMLMESMMVPAYATEATKMAFVKEMRLSEGVTERLM